MEKKYTNGILVKFAIVINFEQKFSREIHQRYDHRKKEKKKEKWFIARILRKLMIFHE